jgi:hypothetical protein
MAKVILVCLRNPHEGTESKLRSKIELLSTKLLPDNIRPRPVAITQKNGLLLAVLNPNSFTIPSNGSAHLGSLIGQTDDWWKLGGDPPDGSYALFRSNEDAVEVLTDIVASRTVWYIRTRDVFVASTSQRAIVSLLGSFEPNEKAFPWMLSSGTLGPGCSWDRRIKALGGDARLLLNRTTWNLSIRREPVEFEPLDLPTEQHKANLLNALEEVFGSVRFDHSKWALSLSGGYDSRLILMLLRNRGRLRSITWGLHSALKDKLSDSYVAERLAEHTGTSHIYFDTDFSDEPVARVFERYLVAGEGRVDHIAGYTDGFKLWKTLFEDNVEGVIRGDHAFGCKTASTPLEARLSAGLSLLSDYMNIEGLSHLQLPEQDIPADLALKDGESSTTWRDRLQHQFRLPYILAALNDLKASYVEISNPLLSRKAINLVRRFPESLRINKSLYREIVHSMSPRIKLAERNAIGRQEDILRDRMVAEWIQDELSSEYPKTILPSEFIAAIAYNIQISQRASLKSLEVRAKHYVKKIFPKSLVDAYKDVWHTNPNPFLDTNALAFRTLIICKMCQMLNQDTHP